MLHGESPSASRPDGGIMGSMSMLAGYQSNCAPVTDWLQDTWWHRRMFGQSMFRWVPEDAMHVLLEHTRGRCVFETPGHLRVLEQHQQNLREWIGQIDDAICLELSAARRQLPQHSWPVALAMTGFTPLEAGRIMRRRASAAPPANPDVRRALHGIPLANPLTHAWELRQVWGMYRAVDNMLEDLCCDLAVELERTHGLDRLASLTTDRSPDQLRWRIERQRDHRGEPGDARRRPLQTYEPLPALAHEADSATHVGHFTTRTRPIAL